MFHWATIIHHFLAWGYVKKKKKEKKKKGMANDVCSDAVGKL